MEERPQGRTDDARAAGDRLTPHVFADWITEDVAQRLYASRQDIADAVVGLPAVDVDAEEIRDRLLHVIRNLQDLATRLRARPEAHASPEELARCAAAVASECEEAQALIARCAGSLTEDRRIRAEGERLARDGRRLQRASVAVGSGATA
ncbi:hypothetical protein [Patulibacter sp.]|uniref:hypothetical protein n=1 Tax=Patulibacter sp. TaxID=1912859 RepID=UPI002718A9E0|nr:hypothetical protein [Patulibacter sp.]MDO9410854.1 hypothetical protein [Patulibacter sp.]